MTSATAAQTDAPSKDDGGTEDLALLHIATGLPLTLAAGLMSFVGATTASPGVHAVVGASTVGQPMPCCCATPPAVAGRPSMRSPRG